MKLVTCLLVATVICSEATLTISKSTQSCDSWLDLCEREVKDLRRYREQVKQTKLDLEYQRWSIGNEKKVLDNAFSVLTHQVNNPGVPVPDMTLSGKGTGVYFYCPEVILAKTAPCRSQLESCERGKTLARQTIEDIERGITSLRTYIAHDTQKYAELVTKATALKQQLENTGVTPHRYSNFDTNLPSFAPHKLDSAEIDRRVAKSLITPEQENPCKRN